MNKLYTGYYKTDINPSLGRRVCGYYVERIGKGFLDDICARVFAMECNGERVLILSLDLCYITNPINARFHEAITKATGIPSDKIFLTVTHSHTAPEFSALGTGKAFDEDTLKYIEFIANRLADICVIALQDMVPTKMAYGVGQAPERVAYIRRYKMKDGSTMTCPPIDDPNIVEPIGELDQRINVLRFDREGRNPFILVNYGVHADTTNGDYFSADFPYWMSKTLDLALEGADSMFIGGAQGDVGSTNVHPDSADMNDTEISFDNEMKSPGMARFVGRAIAGTVLQVYDKLYYTAVDELKMITKTVQLKLNVPKPDKLPLAKKYIELHEAGRDDEIPYSAMELTTVIAEAYRMRNLENGPEYRDMEIYGLKIGPVVLVGIPAEPFTEIGVKIKDTDGPALIMPCALTNGAYGYFPMQSAYDEGGYEARSSAYKAGVAETVIEGGKAIVAEIMKD